MFLGPLTSTIISAFSGTSTPLGNAGSLFGISSINLGSGLTFNIDITQASLQALIQGQRHVEFFDLAYSNSNSVPLFNVPYALFTTQVGPVTVSAGANLSAWLYWRLYARAAVYSDQVAVDPSSSFTVGATASVGLDLQASVGLPGIFSAGVDVSAQLSLNAYATATVVSNWVLSSFNLTVTLNVSVSADFSILFIHFTIPILSVNETLFSISTNSATPTDWNTSDPSALPPVQSTDPTESQLERRDDALGQIRVNNWMGGCHRI